MKRYEQLFLYKPVAFKGSGADLTGGFAMRASLALAFLSGFVFLAGNPALADSSTETKAAADAAPSPAANTPPATGGASNKEAAAQAPTQPASPSAGTAPAPAPTATPATPATGSSSAASDLAAPSTDTAQIEPHKRPVPDGYAAAAELFKAGKFPQAQKEFEKIIASGTADVNTHLCLAHCFLHEKVYSKAIKEFEWLGKYAKNSMSLQKSCQATARSLRNAMNGICPSTCLKGHDPRWTLKAGSKVILVPHNGGGYDTLTPNDIGHSIVYEHGNAVVKGICPVCEGTTQVPVLKDGGPMPRI